MRLPWMAFSIGRVIVSFPSPFQMDAALFTYKLELMFMKHYAPNRCLYIKVAKLRTGLGSAEMSHLQNCSLKIYLKSTGGGGGGGVGLAGGGGGGSGWGVRMDVNEELKFL